MSCTLTLVLSVWSLSLSQFDTSRTADRQHLREACVRLIGTLSTVTCGHCLYQLAPGRLYRCPESPTAADEGGLRYWTDAPQSPRHSIGRTRVLYRHYVPHSQTYIRPILKNVETKAPPLVVQRSTLINNTLIQTEPDTGSGLSLVT